MKKLTVLCIFSVCFILMANAQQKTPNAQKPATKPVAAKTMAKHNVGEKRTHRSSMANKQSSSAVADIYMKPVESVKTEKNPYQLKYGEKAAAIDREIEKMKEEISSNQKISADEKNKKLKDCEVIRKKMMIDMMGEESYIEYKNAGN